jgi:hypothetical protein
MVIRITALTISYKEKRGSTADTICFCRPSGASLASKQEDESVSSFFHRPSGALHGLVFAELAVKTAKLATDIQKSVKRDHTLVCLRLWYRGCKTMTNYSFIHFLPNLILAVSACITVFSSEKRYSSKFYILMTLIAFIVLMIFSFSSPYIFLWSYIAGYFFYILTFLTSLVFLSGNIVCLLFINYIVTNDNIFLEPRSLSAMLTIICFSSLIILLPVAILPNINNTKIIYQNYGQSFDVQFVDKSFENIRNSFGQVQKSISIETSAIDKAIASFKENLKSQEKRLGQLQEDLKMKQAEVERYKALANLTKEQREAIVKEIDRGKIKDYIIGFVLGMVGSLLVEHFPKLFRQLKEGTVHPSQS